MKELVAGLLFAVVGATAVNAAEMTPIQAHTIKLAGVTGVAYYTESQSGYELVATVASENGTPVRFAGTLASGQSFVLSVPGAAGVASQDVKFARIGDRLIVSDGATLTN